MTVTRRMPLLFLTCICLVSGCAALPDERTEPWGFDYALPPEALEPKPVGVVAFMVDGVNPDVLFEMIESGDLPHIKNYFIDQGLWTRRCVANVPSVTLANETSLVTGRFPGRHNVTGINWFDRTRLIWRNYETIAQKNTLDSDYTAPTLYERLADETTFSLFYQAHRGATKFAENWTSAGPPFFFGWYDLVDRIALLRFGIVADVARARGRFPAFTMVYQLAPDMYAYKHGVSSPEYRRALVHDDAHIGRVLADFEASGILDSIVLVLVSDHNMQDVTHHWPVEPFLRDELRLDVARDHLWEETTFENRLAYYRRFACVVSGSGDRYVSISLRKPRPGGGFERWTVRPGPEDLRAYPTRDGTIVDLVETLRRAEAVDVLAYRAGPDAIHVVGKHGTGQIAASADGAEFAYRVVRGEDPLGYAGALPPPMVLGRPHTALEWLEATLETDYPDLVPQLAAYFEASRSADLALFAVPGWDFSDQWKAGHGGVRPEDMFVPLLVAGPGIPKGKLTVPARSVDLVPTVLDLLRRPIPEDLDGRSLLRAVSH